MFFGGWFQNGLFHGTAAPLLSSFSHLARTMGRTGFIAVFAGMLLGGAAAPMPVTTMTQVLAALDRGDALTAQNLSDAALKQETMDARTRACLLLYHGLATELLGAHDRAMRDLTQAIATRALPAEEMGQAYLQRGFLRESLGELDEAIGDYGATIALNGYSIASAFNNRGNIYLRRNRLMDAQADYLAALSADGGQSLYSYYGLGRVAEAEGDKQAARDFYAKAVAIDARYAAASERLSALGGPPDAAASEPLRGRMEAIVLHPPVRKPDAPANADSAVVLHPPSDESEPSAPTPAVPRHPALMPVKLALLRPALDQPDVPAKHGGEVQLGAWRSAAEAHAAWDRAKVRADGALDDVSPRIVAAEVPGKGRYFRLRVRLESGQRGAMCARLAARGQACFPVHD